MRKLMAILVLTTAGCSLMPQITPWGEEGKGMYSLAYGDGDVREPAVARAQAFCAQRGKVKHIVTESGGEFVFKCVDNT